MNAFASLQRVGNAKPQPMVTIHRGWIDKVVKYVAKPTYPTKPAAPLADNVADARLAEVLGHELGHIELRHVDNPAVGTPLVANAITREQEEAADAKGLELDMKAGYSYAEIMDVWKMEYQVLGNYVSFEGLNYDHPSNAERAANIAKDDVQKQLWRSTTPSRTASTSSVASNTPWPSAASAR